MRFLNQTDDFWQNINNFGSMIKLFNQKTIEFVSQYIL